MRVATHANQSFLCAVTIATLGSPSALAVDTSSNDAPDLSAVRSKIKAKDYQGASVNLKALAEPNPHADVYSLMGFSLRKTGDYTPALTFYQKALDFDATTRVRANTWASSTWSLAICRKPGSNSRCSKSCVRKAVKSARISRKSLLRQQQGQTCRC